jgi:hypothetical protein
MWSIAKGHLLKMNETVGLVVGVQMFLGVMTVYQSMIFLKGLVVQLFGLGVAHEMNQCGVVSSVQLDQML